MNETGAKECCFQTKALFYFIKLSNAWIVHTPVLVFGFPWNLSHLVSCWTPLPWKNPSNAVNRDDRLAEGISTDQITLKAMNDEPEPLNHLNLVVESKEHSFTVLRSRNQRLIPTWRRIAWRRPSRGAPPPSEWNWSNHETPSSGLCLKSSPLS